MLNTVDTREDTTTPTEDQDACNKDPANGWCAESPLLDKRTSHPQTNSPLLDKRTSHPLTNSPLLDNHTSNEESPKKSPTHGQHSLTRREIIRNLVILAITWFLIFTAYSTLEILQSSLNNNLGVLTITLVYIFKVISSLMGPYIIVKLSAKWTMVAGYACHTIFVIANFHPTWFTLLPAGILLGMAMGPIWICFGVYVTVLSVKYCEVTGSTKAAVLSKFNGFMAMALPCSFIIGLLLSSCVFKYVSFEDATTSDVTEDTPASYTLNGTVVPDYDNFSAITLWLNDTTHISGDTAQCGPHYCPEAGFVNSQEQTNSRPETKVVYVLIGILSLFNLSGLVLAVFGLQHLPEEDVVSGITIASNICSQIWLYMKAFFDWQFVILAPSITYIFLFLTMMNAMFPKAYITCSIGIEMVGYISMTRGMTGLAMNFLSGWLGQYIHRNYHFGFSMILVVIVTSAWLLWDYWPHELTMLFVTATVAGCANAINLAQFSAFLGYAFTDRKTEAFSFFHFWSGITTAAAFFSNNYICAKHQIYILYVVMVITIATFGYLSYYLHRYGKQDITMEMEVNDQLPDKQMTNKIRRNQFNIADVDAALCASQLSLA